MGKWPKFSAEETSTSTFSKSLLEDIYGLIVTSVPDGMILDDSVTYQQAVTSQQAQGGNKYIRSHVLIEVKHFNTNPDEYVFTGKEAPKVIKKLRKQSKNGSAIRNIIKEILQAANELREVNSPVSIQNKWKVELLPRETKTDGACPIKITDPSRTVATLHQLDTYLLECYLYAEIKGVIWTNGLCWKIWKKNVLGRVCSSPDIMLDGNQRGYVEYESRGNDEYPVPIDASGNLLKAIDIDPVYFAKFKRKLKYFLSTTL